MGGSWPQGPGGVPKALVRAPGCPQEALRALVLGCLWCAQPCPGVSPRGWSLSRGALEGTSRDGPCLGASLGGLSPSRVAPGYPRSSSWDSHVPNNAYVPLVTSCILLVPLTTLR